MQSEPFRYTEEIDKQIVKTLEADLNTEVKSAYKMPIGIGTHVYKIETGKLGTVIAKVFRNKGLDASQKVFWLEDQLTQKGVPHAKILHYSRKPGDFPYGYMVEEFIEGTLAQDVVREGLLTEDEYNRKLAELFRKFHTIHPTKFGELDHGTGTKDSFAVYSLNVLDQANEKLRGIEDFDTSVYDKTRAKVEEILRPNDDRFKPTLVHGDPAADNCIYTSNGELVLIDWEHAFSSIWLDDFAVLTFWGSSKGDIGISLDLRARIKNTYYAIDTDSSFSAEEKDQLLVALDLIYAFKLLPVFLLDQQNQKVYKYLLDRIGFSLDK